MDASFTSLLNKGVYDEVEELCSQPSQQDPTKQKKGRSKNFTIDEDMLLISGWLNVSLDPVQGNNQTQLTYWNRIWIYFNENKTFTSDRTPTSLCNRWSAIQTSVSKFIGYYNQINGRNQSGVTEQDKIGQAMQMYETIMKVPFPFLRCWMELRNSPKFASNITKKNKTTTKDNQPSSPSSPSIESPMSTNMLESEEGMERPIGRKAAKKMKRSKNEATDDEFVQIFKKMKEEVRLTAVSRTEAINNIIKIEEERQTRERVQLEINKAKEERENQIYEASILAIDTSEMEPQIAQYYQTLKDKILSKVL